MWGDEDGNLRGGASIANRRRSYHRVFAGWPACHNSAMLREMQIAQPRHEPPRHWFVDDDFDVIVWLSVAAGGYGRGHADQEPHARSW